MCMLNLSHRILHVHPKVYASLLSQRKKKKKRNSSVLFMAKFCLDLLIPICTSCFTYSVHLSYWPPLWGLRFMPAGADFTGSQVSSSGPRLPVEELSCFRATLSVLVSCYVYFSLYDSVVCIRGLWTVCVYGSYQNLCTCFMILI